MRDWDRLITVIIGLAVATHSGRIGWKAWRRRQPGAAAGSFLLSLLCLAYPILLAVFGR